MVFLFLSIKTCGWWVLCLSDSSEYRPTSCQRLPDSLSLTKPRMRHTVFPLFTAIHLRKSFYHSFFFYPFLIVYRQRSTAASDFGGWCRLASWGLTQRLQLQRLKRQMGGSRLKIQSGVQECAQKNTLRKRRFIVHLIPRVADGVCRYEMYSWFIKGPPPISGNADMFFVAPRQDVDTLLHMLLCTLSATILFFKKGGG